MPKTVHESLVETDDAEIRIETDSATLKPVFQYAAPLVDELRLQVDEDGLSYNVIDPANVAAVGIDVPASVFDTYDVDATALGLPLKRVRQALRAGRKASNDDLTVTHANDTLFTSVSRDYDGVVMDLENTVKLIDTDSVRQDFDTPDLDYTVEATVPRDLFRDALSAVDTVGEYAVLAESDGDLVIAGESDLDDVQARVPDVCKGSDAYSLFSIDYLTDFLRSLASVGVDEVTLRLDEEFPVHATWTWSHEDGEITGEYYQAPRVKE